MSIFDKLKLKTQKMTKDIMMGLIRHILTFLGGTIIAKGVADEATMTELIGGVMTVIGAVWSISSKKK
jgi:hypothetical protein